MAILLDLFIFAVVSTNAVYLFRLACAWLDYRREVRARVVYMEPGKDFS
jgi:hypothetical protein